MKKGQNIITKNCDLRCCSSSLNELCDVVILVVSHTHTQFTFLDCKERKRGKKKEKKRGGERERGDKIYIMIFDKISHLYVYRKTRTCCL